MLQIQEHSPMPMTALSWGPQSGWRGVWGSTRKPSLGFSVSQQTQDWSSAGRLPVYIRQTDFRSKPCAPTAS